MAGDSAQTRPRFGLPFAVLAVVMGLAVVFWPSMQGGELDPLDAEAVGVESDRDLEVPEPLASDPSGQNESGLGEHREEVDERAGLIADPLWVQVNDVHGNPSPKQTIAITSTGELPIWLVGNTHVTGEDGRVVFDRSTLLRIAEASDWQEVIVGVWDWRARGFAVESTVELAQLHEITLEMPVVATILLQLVDVPSGYGPRLQSSPLGSDSDLDPVSLGDGRWRFSPVPLGEEWQVRIGRCFVDESYGWQTFWQEATFPAQSLTGPQLEGETIHAEYRLADHGYASGRLVDEAGEALTIPIACADALTAFGLGRDAHSEDLLLSIELLGEGRFMLVPMYEAKPLGQLKAVYLNWNPSASEASSFEDLAGVGLERARCGSAAVPMGESSIDLGDFVLRSDSELLEVVVTDQNGAPLKDAGVHVHVVSQLERNEPRRPLYRSLFPIPFSQSTNAQGTVQILAPSWQDVLYFGLDADEILERGAAVAIGINVVSVDAVQLAQKYSLETRQIEVSLAPAGQIRGSIDFASMDWASVSVVAYTPGGASSNGKELGREHATSTRNGFWLRGLPRGKFDAASCWGANMDWEFARVAEVEVRPWFTVHPPELQDVPIRRLANWVELEIRSPDGQVESGDAYISLRKGPGDDGVLRSELSQDGSTWSFPLPSDVSSWNGQLHFAGYRSETMDGLGPGRHVITLERARSVELRFTREVPGYGERWTLAYSSRDAAADGRAVGYLRDQEGRPFLDVPNEGTYWIWWHWDAGEPLGLDLSAVEVTEADLERGYVLIDPPEKLK